MFASLLPLLVAPSALASEWPDLTSLASAPAAEAGAPSVGRGDAAVIVAIEDYGRIDDVAGARANADAWTRWLLKMRGVAASRILRAYDADATDIQIRTLATEAAAAVEPGGTLWFVFIGHGAPSLDGADGLLVGADADRSAQGIYQRSVSRSELLGLLDRGAQARTVAVLDACFSGQSPRGEALVAGLQPIVPTALVHHVAQRTTVLTAAGSGEFSGPLAGEQRPAFSYLALGGLMGWADVDGLGNRDGAVSARELQEYVAGALNLTVTGRRQTPRLLGEDAPLARATVAQAPDLIAIADAVRAAGSVAIAPPPSAPAAPAAARAQPLAPAEPGGHYVGQRASGERVALYGPFEVGGSTEWIFDGNQGSFTRLSMSDGVWIEEYVARRPDGVDNRWESIDLTQTGDTVTIRADGSTLRLQRVAGAFRGWDGDWSGNVTLFRPPPKSVMGEILAGIAAVAVDTTAPITTTWSARVEGDAVQVRWPTNAAVLGDTCTFTMPTTDRAVRETMVGPGLFACVAGSTVSLRALAEDALLFDWTTPGGLPRSIGVLHPTTGPTPATVTPATATPYDDD